jgi:SAM-dependent methyltransferase
MYSVLDYGLMADDGVRMSAYARAIERAVTPGSVVLDLGSGTGICALLAARQGARRVYAIDTNPAVWLARDLAIENGFGDRITIFEGSSFDVELPEPVDVIVSDLRGRTPLNGHHLAAVADARARWLRPGGVSIPLRDRLFVGVVEAHDMARLLRTGSESMRAFGFSVEAVRASILNTVHDDRRRPLPASTLISTAESWATVDYWSPKAPSEVYGGSVTLTATRRGLAHGFVVWFAASITDDIGYSSAPGQELAYARCFLPFPEPVALIEDESIEATLRADARGERWCWDTVVRNHAGVEKARFRQASFLGMPTSPAALLKGAASARPSLSGNGERIRRLLNAMNGTRSVEELISEVLSDVPNDSATRPRMVQELRDAVRTFGA